jgi:hypothetical protein
MKLFGGKKPQEPVGRRRPLRPESDVPSRPNPAFSYYSQRSDSQVNTGRRDTADVTAGRTSAQPPAVVRRRRLIMIALSVVVLAGAVYALPLSPTVHVILLQDAATAHFLQDGAVYRQTAEKSLSTSIFNRNKLTVNTAAVRLDLLKNYPEIKDVSVALPLFGRQPQVYVEPYKPSFILTTTSNTAFLLDATGRALAMTNQVPDIDKLGVLTLQDRSGVPVALGVRAVPSTTVTFAQTVSAALKAASITPSSLVLPAKASELDVYVAGTPYFVKFNLQNDALQQAGTYLATRQRLEADHIKPGQYIDVRVPERAYYK